MNAIANPNQETADLSAFRTHRAWQICIVGCAFTLLFSAQFSWSVYQEVAFTEKIAVDVDFRVFWAAAKIAFEGNFLDIFSLDALFATHQIKEEAWMPWLYPPGYLIFITPIGALSFPAAYAAFNALSIVVMAYALRPLTHTAPALWLSMTLAPAFLPAIILGQNSLLWCAGLLFALSALRANKFVLSGFLFGLLTLKPQLGLMVPIALLAVGAWRGIFAAAVTTISIAALPTFIYGLEYWVELSKILSLHGENVRNNIDNLSLMIGALPLFLEMGFSVEDALSLQWGVSIACACLVFVIWRQKALDWDTKFATLIATTLLSVPYLWHYESVMFAPLGVFMLRAGVINQRFTGYIILFVLWIGITPFTLARMFQLEFLPVPRYIAAPMAIGALILILLHAFKTVQQNHATPDIV